MYGTAYLSLSLLPLQSTHLKTDLINIGHYKNLNTIGKQNYQAQKHFAYAHNIRYVMLCYDCKLFNRFILAVRKLAQVVDIGNCLSAHVNSISGTIKKQ